MSFEEVEDLLVGLRYGLPELVLNGGGTASLSWEAGAKVLLKPEPPGPSAAEGSGSFIGSMRRAAACCIVSSIRAMGRCLSYEIVSCLPTSNPQRATCLLCAQWYWLFRIRKLLKIVQILPKELYTNFQAVFTRRGEVEIIRNGIGERKDAVTRLPHLYGGSWRTKDVLRSFSEATSDF